jgi:hypothetical protein
MRGVRDKRMGMGLRIAEKMSIMDVLFFLPMTVAIAVTS